MAATIWLPCQDMGFGKLHLARQSDINSIQMRKSCENSMITALINLGDIHHRTLQLRLPLFSCHHGSGTQKPDMAATMWLPCQYTGSGKQHLPNNLYWTNPKASKLITKLSKTNDALDLETRVQIKGHAPFATYTTAQNEHLLPYLYDLTKCTKGHYKHNHTIVHCNKN